MRKLLVGLVMLSLSACSGGTDAPPTVTGTWAGASGSLSMSMTLSQSSASVTGSGIMIGPSGSVAFTVTGTFVEPTLSLTTHASGYEDMNYTGALSGDQITGHLNGSGFTNYAITISR